MKVYLDNCSFNRPFDNQSQIRVKIETDAKLYIQQLIKAQELELVWSYILEFQNTANPFEERKKQISKWKSFASEIIVENEKIILLAENFVKQFNFKAKDALHLACAIESNAKYLITTDDFILKKTNLVNLINIVSPLTFLEKEDI